MSCREWIARLLYTAVFISNMICIVAFITSPQDYTASYEVIGSKGAEAAICGIGVAFAMWNVTYPFYIIHPKKNRTLGLAIIVQQLVGLIGELYIQKVYATNLATLSSSITRFVWFDAGGLVLLVSGFICCHCFHKSESRTKDGDNRKIQGEQA